MEAFEHIVNELESNLTLIPHLLESVSETQQLWKPKPDSWCLKEVICHMVDEEISDFRFRTRFILEHPNTTPPPFDPVRLVTEKRYMEQDFDKKIDEFQNERQDSLAWLKSLDQPDWDASFEHIKLGRMTAGYYLNNWLAHDYLHIRQITKLKFDYLRKIGETDLDYAGNW